MLGLCCQYMCEKLKKNGSKELINILNERHLQFGRYKKGDYSKSDIHDVWLNNTTELLSVLKRIKSEGYSVMRISSGLLPLYDLAEADLKSDQQVLDKLREIGSFVKDNKMRVTQHPDQFCVLSSETPSVVNNAVVILEHHAWIFDQMGLDKTPFYAINVHGGKKGNSKQLIEVINTRLSDSAKNRLTLENDERGYSVKDLYKVFESTNVPTVMDTHHHTFLPDGLEMEEALNLSISTWGTVKPLTHLSNTTPGLEEGNFTEKRKHSDYVTYIPDCQLQANNSGRIDIEMEFKMKNLAIEKAVKDFGLIL